MIFLSEDWRLLVFRKLPTMMSRIRILVLIASTSSFFVVLRADTVVLSAGDDNSGTVEITGEIVDYTGGQITVRRPGGVARDYPARRIKSIDTEWPDGFEEGADALDSVEYARAAGLLAAAARVDQRPWVRRMAMEKLMECYASGGDATTAGRLLVELAKSDPATPALEHGPLAWFATNDMAPAIIDEWLRNEASPVAQLLGASYALSGSGRADAAAKLERLKKSPNESLAWLAEMQSWRGKVATVKPSDVSRWKQRLRDAPESLQAGGWLVLGDAHRQLRQFDPAALAYLRCHLLANRQPQLAGEALWRASRVLAAAGQTEEAAKLSEQLLNELPQTAAARQARGVLQSP